MNIFIFLRCARKSARHHCKKHTIKMILEYLELLGTAIYVLHAHRDGLLKDLSQKEIVEHYKSSEWIRRCPVVGKNKERIPGPYRCPAFNHPAALWTRTCQNNFMFVLAMCETLLETYRIGSGGKIHASSPIVEWVRREVEENTIPFVEHDTTLRTITKAKAKAKTTPSTLFLPFPQDETRTLLSPMPLIMPPHVAEYCSRHFSSPYEAYQFYMAWKIEFVPSLDTWYNEDARRLFAPFLERARDLGESK